MLKILEMQHSVGDVTDYQSRVIEYKGTFDDYYKDLYIGDMGIREADLPLRNIKKTSETQEVICNFFFNHSDGHTQIHMVHFAKVIN